MDMREKEGSQRMGVSKEARGGASGCIHRIARDTSKLFEIP